MFNKKDKNSVNENPAENDYKVSDEELLNKYNKYFDKDVAAKLLVKLRKATRDKPAVISGAAGSLVTVLGKLISALENPDCPAHYKALIIGAIGYIVLPFDIVPDALPGVGWVDDLTVAGGVVATVAIYSDFSLEKLDAYIDQMDD